MQIALDAFRARNQDRRIARSPGHLARGNRLAGHTANSFDDFANAEAAPGTKIVNKLVLFTQSVEHQDVRASEITDMNVVSNASAIRRRVIRSKKRDVF